MSIHLLRSKWSAVGAAIAVSLGAGGIGITHATTSSGEKPIYLPIEPCRLSDTRAAFQVGPRSAALGPTETYTLSGQGAVGNCNLPTGTTALSLNVTAIDATAPTFLTLFPAGGALPVASHLNPLPGQGPVPNAVNVDLSAGGEFSIYNLAGNVHIIIDVVGIFDDHNHDDRYYQKSEVDTAMTAGTDVVTELFYSGANTESSPGSPFELLREVGTFTKQSSTTDIRLDWYGHHRYVGTDNSDFCHYQLRIDGLATDGGTDLSFGTGGDVVSYAQNTPFTTFAYFDGLSTGDHGVQVYVRGNATSCTVNPGNFDQQVVVTEFTSN